MDNIKIKEILRFGVSGGLAVLTDGLVYWLLTSPSIAISSSVAKAISFVAGSIVAFILNRIYTFKTHTTSAKSQAPKFILLYLFTFGCNVLAHNLLKNTLEAPGIFAFLGATGTSTVLNYIGQKYWVFSK